ncbi:MAG: hypothetical protein RJA07_1228 [Bacteroidota bacterium]|jgi:hypothetical protein
METFFSFKVSIVFFQKKIPQYIFTLRYQKILFNFISHTFLQALPIHQIVRQLHNPS